MFGVPVFALAAVFAVRRLLHTGRRGRTATVSNARTTADYGAESDVFLVLFLVYPARMGTTKCVVYNNNNNFRSAWRYRTTATRD